VASGKAEVEVVVHSSLPPAVGVGLVIRDRGSGELGDPDSAGTFRHEEVEALHAIETMVQEIDRRYGGERRRGLAFSVEARLEGCYPETVLRLRARYGTDDEVCYDDVFPLWEPTAAGYEPSESLYAPGVAFSNLEEDVQGRIYFLFATRT
jgi:hypothetical protein